MLVVQIQLEDLKKKVNWTHLGEQSFQTLFELHQPQQCFRLLLFTFNLDYVKVFTQQIDNLVFFGFD